MNDKQRDALSGFFERGVSTQQAIDRVMSAVKENLSFEERAHLFLQAHQPEPGGCTCGFCIYSTEHVLVTFAQECDRAADARTRPEGNKTLPRCEVPDCVNQASFIINERALCKDHVKQGPHPPSLRK